MSGREKRRSRSHSVLSTKHSVLIGDSVLSPVQPVPGVQEVTQSSVLSPQSMSLRIGDITIHLFTEDPEMKLQVEGAIRDFLVDEAQPNIRVRAAWAELSRDIMGHKLFDSGSVWQLYCRNGSYLFRFATRAYGLNPYKIAIFDSDFSVGEVYLHRPYFNPAQPINPLEYPLDELLITHLLARGGGVEIHACGLIDLRGNGCLFVGQSEAGKTTMARLWQKQKGVTILSDDRIILRKLGKKIWMYGTPWHGDAGLACPARAPLMTVYFLRHDQKNELIFQRPVDALARLFACSFPLFYNREALDSTFTFLEDVVKNVPCYELQFKPDNHVLEFVQHEHSTSRALSPCGGV